MNNMRKLFLFLMMSFFLPSFLPSFLLTAGAQERVTVTGSVKDAGNAPVIAATVFEQGTTNGTSTDADGAFRLSIAKGGTLVVSCVGFETRQLRVSGNRTYFEVVLKEDTQFLSEVVVTGYGGTQLRSKVTNSIAKVNEETFKVGVFSNPGQALSGAVSGLKVTNYSGSPNSTPSISLRGGTNWDGSGTPLVVVDGMLRESGFQDINPEDIESMDVLKDAGATAIYGARASNGVIFITTKKGRTGTAQISLKARVGLNYHYSPLKYLGTEDYISWIRRAYVESPWAPVANLNAATPFGLGNSYGEDGSTMVWNIMKYDPKYDFLLSKGWKTMDDSVSDAKIMYRETNLKKYNMNSPALTQDYNINMSGGNDRGHYYASFGYNKIEGMPIKMYNERYNVLFNGDYMVSPWLKSVSNFSYSRGNWMPMPYGQDSEANYFGRIMSLPPTARFEDESGNMLLGPNSGDGNQSFNADKFWYDYQRDKFTISQTFEASILKNLILKGSALWFINESATEYMIKDYMTRPGAYNRTRLTGAQFNRYFSQTYNATIQWKETYADRHDIDLLLGAEYYDIYNRGFKADGQGANTDDFADLGLTLNGEGKRTIDSWHSRQRILSYFGRLNYDYDDKYLVSATFRYDGYSSLLGSNRWGFFPGVSAGWVFGKENFVADNLHWLSFGKLRASYGLNGNASGIGAYDLQGSYANTAIYNGNNGFRIAQLSNPGLRWERTRTAEAGVDLGFLQNRLNVNLTYYNRLTLDKYANFTLPSTTGFSSIKNNNGKYRNKGLEIEVAAKVLRKQDFSWDLKANIAYNKNKVVALPFNNLSANRQGGTEIYTGKKLADGTYETIYVGGYQEGQEPGFFTAYKFDGIWQSDDEVPYDFVVKTGNINGKYMYSKAKYMTLSDAEKSRSLYITAGDAKWRDINGDGVIDSRDQVKVGNSTPRWFGGFNTVLNWKGFQLYARFDYALGFWTMDVASPWYNGCGQGTYNATTDVFDTWTPDNTGAKYPKYVYADQLGKANYFRNSTLFSYRGDYLAFREVSLSWSLPKTLLNRIRLQNITLSVTGQNLGYLTAAPTNTPEVARVGFGASGDGYGLPRTVLFGLDITF